MQRRSDWEGTEAQAKSLLGSLAKTVPASFEERRQRTVETLGRLSGIGVPVAPEVPTELDALAHPPEGEAWSTTASRLLRTEETLRKAEIEYVTGARERALRVARWAGLSPERLAQFEGKLDEAVRPAREGRLAESMDQIGRLLREDLPEAAARRRQVREMAAALVSQAKEHGAPTSKLEAALDAGADADPESWPEAVPASEKAVREAGEALRERCIQSLQGLKTSLGAASEFGVDPKPAEQVVEEAIARIGGAPLLEIAPIFVEARRSAEEPVVTVIAGLLDEVRPRIAEARRLGRDPSEVFASMNRAREALRLKIYSEAFAASREALDRVTRLTEDLEAVEDEFQAVQEMVGRFRAVGFATDPFEPSLERVRAALERTDVAAARETLKGIVTELGRDALDFFLARWNALDKLREYARDRGFLTPATDRGVAEGRDLLDRGEIAESAERIARSEVEIRTAAAPYIARRVEEMEQGLSDIPDETLTAPVRRLLADADVSLRVKEDLSGAIESLRHAEHEFSAVFAAHASSLVEVLESEGRVLESMGGATDEIQRQIDEVQQIFNMGDFVKASRSSQEIRTRAQQQQLLRSEEAVSHAKLSLVELETMGLDLAKFRTDLDDAQVAARAGRYLDAFQQATRLEQAAARARATAQQILDSIARAVEALGRLSRSGIDPGTFYDGLRTARLAFQSFEFDAARAGLESLHQKLGEEEARLETSRLLAEVNQLTEDGRRLSTPMDPFTARWKQLKTEQATAPPDATRTAAQLLHEELVTILKPVLEENLRTLERDLDIARSAGVNVEKILVPLSEARRRVSLPVPVGAAELLDTARAEFVSTHGFVEHADRVAKRAREALAQADLLHVEAVALRSGMDRLEQLLSQQQYARVIELGGPLERELLQATYQHVSKSLAGFQAIVSRMRPTGIDTTLAENLLHQARTSLDDGRPVDALQLASRSEAELERAELQRHLAEGSIEAVSGALARTVADGIVAPTAAEEFEAAKAAFHQRAYPDVLERAMTSLDALGVAREGHRRAREAVQAGARQVSEAVEQGADVGEANARLAEARSSVEKGLYSDAIRAARESTEMGRWAIERLFAPALGELRRQVEFARKEGLTREVEPLDAVVTDAEAALRARDWAAVRQGIERGEAASRHAFEAAVDGRWREVEAEYGRAIHVPTAELSRREEAKRQLAALRERREYAAALGLIRAEHEVVRKQWREALEAQVTGFKDRLWVGERLGIDTTRVMQTFSEARVAIDSGQFDSAEAILIRATAMLEPSVREPFGRRSKEIQTEVMFAQEGLRVSVGAVRERLKEVEELDRNGRLLDAARLLLKVEEELNLRKSLHRELLNLHYLIDAAIGRANERHLDTTVARALLSESIRLRDTDYPAALEKAREALRKLQEEGAVAPEGTPAPPPASSFWPFRRPPSEP